VSLDRHADRMVARAKAASQRWSPSTIVDVAAEMHCLTLSVVGDVLFSVDLEGRTGEVREALGAAVRSLDPLISLLAPTRRMRQARECLHRIVDDVIRQRLQSGTDEMGHDLLSLLLSAHDPRKPASSEQLRDDVLTILLAGHDTIGNALAWTWMLLDAHPEGEGRLHQELQETLKGRLPTASDFSQLKYSRGVVAESLRLFPPAWVIARRVLTEYRLDRVTLPQGSLVVMSQFLMHRDARFFPQPLAFDPTRWNSECEASRPKLSFFPFGAGPRSCIGEGFAWMEGVLLIATLAQTWRLARATADPVEMEPRVTLGVKPPMLMRLERRS
jgi:cytochrome P450